MAIIYTTLKEPISYIIKENSILNAVTPLGRTGVTAIDISTPFKRGTYATTQDVPRGTITFSEISDRVCFKYVAKAGFYDDDSFEFLITYSDGTKDMRIIDLQVKKSPSTSDITNKYIELWIEDDSETGQINIESEYANLLNKDTYPTKIALSASDSGMSIEKYISIFNQNYSENIIKDIKTGTEITGLSSTKTFIPNDGSAIVTYLPSINLKLTRTLPFDRAQYMIVRFKEFANKSNGMLSYGEECVYVIFNARRIYEKAASSSLTAAEIIRPTNPTFVEHNVDYPEIPDNEKKKYTNDFIVGDLLENTNAHKDFDEFNNRTIRLGETVPDGAVNLGYYYNAVSSFTDTISIQETNTNIVSVKYAEEWITRNGLPTKDDNQFPDFIEFNDDDKTSSLYGYAGTLRRDYVAWDEKIDIDQEPEAKTLYEQFRGMSSNQIPMECKYNDGIKSGTLTYTHAQYIPLDFFDDSVHSIKSDNLGLVPKKRGLYTNRWEIPRYWLINAKYEGIVSKNIILYNGSAKYTGAVVKKDGLSNIDPEQDKELRLYPDENGMLYDLTGNNLMDDELFYITDKFKDDEPLYFRYRLKYRIYNSLGKDKYGNYQNDNIKLINESNAPIPSKYKHKVFLEPTEWTDIYDAYVYTNFVPNPSSPVYVMYDGIAMDAYVGALNISPLNVRVGITEKLSVIQAMDVEDYTVKKAQGITEQSTIEMNNFEVVFDQRNKIRIQYVISAAGVKTPPIDAEIINKKYALYSELNKFKDDELIISTENSSGYMTAKDILLKFAGESHRTAIESAKIFKVGFNLKHANTIYSMSDVILYTDPDGNGLIYAKTYADTGLKDNIDENRYNKTLDPDSIYRSQNGRIYKGFAVRCRNINQIVISAPDETSLLKDWYPKIKYSYFNKTYNRVDSDVKLIYSIPEFHTQVWGVYGAPYKDTKNETPKYVGNRTIKTVHAPLYVKLNSAGDPINIKCYKTLKDGTIKTLTVESFNFKYGYITFEEQISDNDNVSVNYTYEEQYFHYKGYYEKKDKNTKLIDFNINPSMYSTYTDTESEVKEEKQCYNLFNKTVFFFLRPMRKIDNKTGTVIEGGDNDYTIYHKFNTQEAEGPLDLLIGRIFVRHHASQKSTTLLDTRSRGGGVIEAMDDNLRRELEPDSDYYLDIGTLDGKPYQENSVIVIRLDKRLLKVNGGNFSEDQVRAAVQRWSAFGMYPIIEYVDVILEDDMPQNTIKVNKYVENQIRYNPYIQVEILDK